jgi:hypothetical protein
LHKATCCIVIVGSDSKEQKKAAGKMADIFNIEEELALQVIKSAPIELLSFLTSSQAKNIYSAINELSGCGLDIEINDVSDDSLPRVSWPQSPDINGVALVDFSDEPLDESAESVVTCPVCGTKLFMQIVQTLVPHAAEADSAVEKSKNENKNNRDVEKESSSSGKISGDISEGEKEKNSSGGIKDKAGDVDSVPGKGKGSKERKSSGGKTEADGENKEAKKSSAKPPVITDSDVEKLNVVTTERDNPDLIRLLMKHCKLDIDGAKKLAERKTVPIARGVDRPTARKIREIFKDAGITVKVTRKKIAK